MSNRRWLDGPAERNGMDGIIPHPSSTVARMLAVRHANEQPVDGSRSKAMHTGLGPKP